MLIKPGSLMIPFLTKGNNALQFDGSQNFVTLGTMGTFGSSIGLNDGFYCSFDMRTTSVITNAVVIGTINAAVNCIQLFLNVGGVSGKFRIHIGDQTKDTDGFFTNTALVDGAKHTIVITVTPSTNTITATIDGAAQSITMSQSETPNSFIDFPRAIYIGCQNNAGTAQNFIDAVIDNVKLGTSAGTLFGNYAIDEGIGNTIADTSGQNNTGTLTGTPKPTWTTM